MRSRLQFDISWRRLLAAAAGGQMMRDASAVRAVIQDAFPAGEVVVGLSVRTLFDALLAELQLPPGAPILMSGVTIQNMADIVHAHRAQVCSVDVSAETLATPSGALMAAHAATGAAHCVVTQLFGAANAFDDLAALKARGVFVIEDAAQAFAGAAHQGLCPADVSLFSFGPIKRRTALGGGVAVFRDKDLAARVARRLRTYPPLSEAWFRARAIKYLVLKAASMPWLYAALMGALKATGRDPDVVIGAMARGFGGKELLPAIRRQPPRRMVALLAHQIRTAPDPMPRRVLCSEFADALPAQARVGKAARNNAHWLMPIVTRSPETVIAKLRAAGFDATRGATSLRALDPSGNPQAHALMKTVVYLPNPAEMPSRARTRLLRAVHDALLEEKSSLPLGRLALADRDPPN